MSYIDSQDVRGRLIDKIDAENLSLNFIANDARIAYSPVSRFVSGLEVTQTTLEKLNAWLDQSATKNDLIFNLPANEIQPTVSTRYNP